MAKKQQLNPVLKLVLDIGPLGGDCMLIIGPVHPHQRLPGADGLAGIDPALGHLSRDTECEIALDPSRHEPGKAAL